MSLFDELKRRNVIRVGAAYVLIAWVFLQAADFGLDLIGAPNWIIQALFLLATLGLPAVLAFSWVFEMTPEGLKLEQEVDRSQSITPQTGRKLDRIIIVFLAITVAFLIASRFEYLQPAGHTGIGTGQRVDAEPHFPPTGMPQKSIAVLPFLSLSSGEDDEFFADGLTEEILNALAQLPELQVTARTSAFHFKGQNLPTGEIAASLGVDHIVEGSVRRSGDRLRVTAQLIRAADGFHLWSENYDRTMEDAIALQEDIAEKIAEAMDVILDDARRALMRRAGVRDVEAFVAFQKGNRLHLDAHGSANMLDMLRKGNEYLEQAIERVPGFSDAYRIHSDYYMHILLDHAAGQPMPGITDEEVDQAYDNAIRDFGTAARVANNPSLKENLLFDLAIIQGDWRDLQERFERMLTADTCTPAVWAHPLGASSVFRARYIEKLRGYVSCDPLTSTFWSHLAGNSIWNQDPASALDTLAEAENYVDNSWFHLWKTRALLLAADPDRAETAINIEVTQPDLRLQSLALFRAAKGDLEGARDAATAWQREFGPSDWQAVMASAQSGDRKAANRHAAAIDARPMGHLSLWLAIYWCTCGAPFDLEAVPNFAAKWADLGLPWPPTTPVPLPLKDW